MSTIALPRLSDAELDSRPGYAVAVFDTGQRAPFRGSWASRSEDDPADGRLTIDVIVFPLFRFKFFEARCGLMVIPDTWTARQVGYVEGRWEQLGAFPLDADRCREQAPVILDEVLSDPDLPVRFEKLLRTWEESKK